jgi:hypothetical protein
MKRMPPTPESIEILTAEKESLQDRLITAERTASQLRANLRKLSELLSAVPGLPVEAYKLLR